MNIYGQDKLDVIQRVSTIMHSVYSLFYSKE